ncbi:MAG: hypothetical protein L3K06_02090, partial [Thermoplasmata archaeon]|nr:hypothetical protein [Thermoplasmata archaeon]
MILDPLISVLRAVLLEPTFGFPLVVALGALGAWVLWSPPLGERRLPPLRRSWFEPESDLPSQMYYALMDGQYSRVLSATAARLDETVRARRGLSVYELPWTAIGAENAHVLEAPDLRRALRRISRAHAESVE